VFFCFCPFKPVENKNSLPRREQSCSPQRNSPSAPVSRIRIAKKSMQIQHVLLKKSIQTKPQTIAPPSKQGKISIYDSCTKRWAGNVATSPAIPSRRIGLTNGPDVCVSQFFFKKPPRTLEKLTRTPASRTAAAAGPPRPLYPAPPPPRPASPRRGESLIRAAGGDRPRLLATRRVELPPCCPLLLLPLTLARAGRCSLLSRRPRRQSPNWRA
jgi:hypothetical protein